MTVQQSIIVGALIVGASIIESIATGRSLDLVKKSLRTDIKIK
jgi:hypothetical protein